MRRGARRDLADLEAARGHHRHAVDVGATALEAQLEAFRLVAAEMLGADLADLVTRGIRAELQVDDGAASPRGRRNRCRPRPPPMPSGNVSRSIIMPRSLVGYALDENFPAEEW